MKNTVKKYIGYTRVSTKKQGLSGLGLESQINMLNDFVKNYGGELVAIYTDIESGKKDDRSELQKAINHASIINGELLVAKLDRLSRNLNMITTLQKNEVGFVICDLPNADSFTIHIYGALAQKERELIVQRTKAGQAVKKQWYKDNEAQLKAEGKRYCFGTNNLTKDGILLGNKLAVETIKDNADSFAVKLKPIIENIKSENEKITLRQIAEKLELLQIKTARGKAWTAMAVKNLIGRIESLK